MALQGEELSTDREASVNYVSAFSKLVEEQELSLSQVFNRDETRLNFRLLPDKTLAACFEKSADGRKLSKERVTINTCSNATGTIKLPLQIIGKARRTRCFKGLKMDLML